jgi:hypothetical protein
LAEIIILFTYIGSNNIQYLKRIFQNDEQICNIYFNCIEKYVSVKPPNSAQSFDKLNLDKNNIYIKIEKDKKKLIELVKEQESRINEYKKIILDLTKEKTELILEKKQNITKESTELFSNDFLMSQFKVKSKEKDIKISSLKSQIISKKEKEKIFNLEKDKENISFLNNTNTIKGNELLMIKLKRLKINLEEKMKYDEFPHKIQLFYDIDEIKQKNVLLTKANESLKNEMCKIAKSYLLDKERIKKLELENKKINNEKNEKIISKGKILDKIVEEDESQINENKSKVDEILLENKILKSKIISISQENQKLSLDIKKIELDNQRLQLALDRMKNETKKYSDDNKCLNEKILEINKIKKRELDKLKKEVDDKVKIIDKILQEKKEMIKNCEKLQNELTLFKNFDSSNNKKFIENHNYNDIVKDNDNILSNPEISELKNEIQNLNLLLLVKNEEIKKLKEEKHLSDDGNDLKLDFYKKLYEEQKKRVNKEHELISKSLYKLAVHFMSLKDDLQKKIKK